MKDFEYKVYGKPNCPMCDKAKFMLSMYGKEYDYIDLSLPENTLAMESFIEQGIRTLPIIYNGDKMIKSVMELHSTLTSGE